VVADLEDIGMNRSGIVFFQDRIFQREQRRRSQVAQKCEKESKGETQADTDQ
jgi:hypothetical protein